MSRIIRELLEAVILALLVFFVIQISVQNFRVEGHSMQPTLTGEEYLLVNKLTYFRLDIERLARLVPFWDVAEGKEKFAPFSHPPERGNVIVFHSPNNPEKDFVKRVVGLPGERVRISDGRVFINGAELPEPYLDGRKRAGSMDCIPKAANCRLGENEYFVMGDNRGSSNDSRDWGPVGLSNVVGKVWFIYWPFSELPFVGRFDKYLEKISLSDK